jgi:cell division protein FtsN
MSRNYKSTNRKKTNGKSSPMFVGLLVGLLIGVVLSVALTIYIKSSGSPFSEISKPEDKIKPVEDKKTEDRPAHTQENKPSAGQGEKTGENGKPRFDFYKILPGSESAVSEQEIKKNEQQADQANQAVNYYLQVGAFQTEQEADNMKAKLALLGMESVIQTANVPEKGVWHRVRVGPFTELSQTDKAKEDLTQNGFKADLIKVKIDATNQ